MMLQRYEKKSFHTPFPLKIFFFSTSLSVNFYSLNILYVTNYFPTSDRW